jgi:hypothetical protein
MHPIPNPCTRGRKHTHAHTRLPRHRPRRPVRRAPLGRPHSKGDTTSTRWAACSGRGTHTQRAPATPAQAYSTPRAPQVSFFPAAARAGLLRKPPSLPTLTSGARATLLKRYQHRPRGLASVTYSDFYRDYSFRDNDITPTTNTPHLHTLTVADPASPMDASGTHVHRRPV